MEEITITTPACDTNDKIVLTATGTNADYNKTIRIPKKKMVIRKKKVVEEVKSLPVIHLIPGETDIREWEGFGYLYLKPCHEECDENGNYCDCQDRYMISRRKKS